MIKGITQNGFEFVIEKDALDDWEIFEAISELDEKPQSIIKVAKLLLGQEQYSSLKEHCRENGRVKLTKMSEEINYILSSNKETKN